MINNIEFKSTTKTTLEDLKPSSFVVITVDNGCSIKTYTGIVSDINKKHVGFKRASCVEVYKSNGKGYVSKMLTYFSIERSWITSIECSEMYESKY